MSAPKNYLVIGWVRTLVTGGALLLVYHKRVGIEDAEGISLVRLMLRPDVWFSAAVGVAMLGCWRRCVFLSGNFRPASAALSHGPWCALATAIIGTLAGWYWHGIAMNKFGEQVAVRLVLCALLGALVYNLAVGSDRFSARLTKIFTLAPAINVALALIVMVSPEFVKALFGPGMLVEGDGLFSLGARYQGLTSNPNMVASSSMVAFSMLLPRLQLHLRSLGLRGFIYSVYVIGLSGVIIWSGVRAVVLILVLMVIISLWLSFRLTRRSFQTLLRSILALGILSTLGAAVLWRSGVFNILLERLEGGDGRLFLWKYYARLLVSNPLGLGFGFESIAQSDQILPGQRLPPHNTFLEMGMYGGVAGILVHFFVLVVIWRAILRTRAAHGVAPLPLRLQSLILGWVASGVALFFAGLIFTDNTYVLLSALLLAELWRDRQNRRVRIPSRREPTFLQSSAQHAS